MPKAAVSELQKTEHFCWSQQYGTKDSRMDRVKFVEERQTILLQIF